MSGFGTEVDLSVSITVKIQVEVPNNMTKRREVTDKEKGALDRALGVCLGSVR